MSGRHASPDDVGTGPPGSPDPRPAGRHARPAEPEADALEHDLHHVLAGLDDLRAHVVAMIHRHDRDDGVLAFDRSDRPTSRVAPAPGRHAPRTALADTP